MDTRTINSWKQFQDEIQQLQEGPDDNWLFRGHSHADWKLQTTLEREVGMRVTVADYYKVIESIKPEIETRTRRSWDIPSHEKFEQDLEENRSRWQPSPGQLYEYMVYLRHHGFPSPLLDWSTSPFVAACFAVSNTERGRRRDNCAVFAYLENPRSASGGFIRRVRVLHHNVPSHERHFQQQSQYTVCHFEVGKKLYYENHELDGEPKSVTGDFYKLILTPQVKLEALRYLDQHNLHAMSLLNSDEAMMKTLAIRQYGKHWNW